MRLATIAVRALVFHISGARPAALHVVERRAFLAVIGEGEACEPAFRRHHERTAEWRRMESEVDRRCLRRPTSIRPATWLRGSRTDRAGGPGRTAHFVAGIEHACGVAQQLPRAVERERLQERLRRQSGPAAEQVMQFGRCDAGRLGNGFDFGLLTPMAADMADGLAHHVVVGGRSSERQRIWNAIG